MNIAETPTIAKPMLAVAFLGQRTKENKNDKVKKVQNCKR